MGFRRIIRTAGVVALASLVVGAIPLANAGPLGRAAPVPGPLRPASDSGGPISGSGGREPRVLFLGDSVMDQQGAHAVALLEQSGIDARLEAHWGSTLFTPGQYRNGRPVRQRLTGDPATHWLSLGPALVERWRPTHVVVELDHNYPQPATDASGRPITDLRSGAARRLVETQLRVFVSSLRARGAQVWWVAPTPSISKSRLLWPMMRRALRGLHVPIIDPNGALRSDAGGFRTVATDCRGVERAQFVPDGIHLTRFGAGVSGTALARAVARRIKARLIDASAPGEPAVAVVAWPGGYHVVQCDGSVFRFGEAPAVGSARSRIAGGPPVVDAVASPDGGLWLLRADASVIALGTNGLPTTPLSPPATEVERFRVDDPAGGYRLIDRVGHVVEREGASDLGDATETLPIDPYYRTWAIAFPRPPIIDVAGIPGGFYVVTENGEVVARGAALHHGDTADLALFTD